MKWFILFVGIVVICFVVALLLGLVGGGMGRPTTSLSHEPLPDGEIRDDDFDQLVFDVTARGYRMSQVDGVVDRLRRALREKDEEIAVLRAEARGGHPGAGERVESFEPAESIESVRPVESGAPVRADEPVDSAAPTAPDESGAPTGPVEPDRGPESERVPEPTEPAEPS